jgi:hypothetical protein
MDSLPSEKTSLPRPLVDAWQADLPSTGELRRGYARFMRKRSKRAVPVLARWIITGLVLGVGLAQAATLVPKHWLGPHEQMALTPKTAPAPTEQPRQVGEATVVAPSEAASALPIERTRTASPAVPAALPSATPAQRAMVQEQWQRAAAAMRAKDVAGAQSALLDVELHTTGAERDAARLARAQLLASSGRRAEALSLAAELAATAASIAVREKARELSSQLAQEKDPEHRSPEPGAAVKQP